MSGTVRFDEALRDRPTTTTTTTTPGGSMKPTSAAIKVGITALVIALVGFMAFRFVAKGLAGSQGYRVWCIFHDATGLVEKSRVQIAGLNIGQIVDRRLEGLVRAHHPSRRPRDAAVVERDGVQEVGVAARRVLSRDRSRHRRVARSDHRQDAEESPAQRRRSDPQRRRGGVDVGHPGAGERDAAGAARDPAGRAQADAGAAAGHRQERAARRRQELGGRRAAAQAPRRRSPSTSRA